jgi:hypothetical protein
MKHRLLFASGLVGLGWLALGTSPVEAQTVAPGPYYATPSWDQTLACTTLATRPRFIVLSNMNSDAVLDRETGLVWERSPDESIHRGDFGAEICTTRIAGNRQGWRLSTVQELRSLIDPSKTGPALPDGHPFSNLHFAFSPPFMVDVYWTATEESLNPGFMYQVSLYGTFISISSPRNSAMNARVWCVRGGQGTPVQ